MSEENELPEGWAIARVTDIANVVEPGFPYGNYNTVGIGFPQLRPMNIDGQGRLCLDEIKYVDIDSPPLLQSGDILFNNTNSPVWVGKTTIISQGDRFTFSNHMTRVNLNPHAGAPQFFALQLQYLQQSGYFKVRCNHHVNQASISSSYLSSNVDLLMAPLFEQHRIVAAIEQQFTRLDAAVTALQHTKAKLKRYRASVLKAAVEGKLTEAWRAEHPATESTNVLLERILVERRAKWEAYQLSKMETDGKLPHDDRWKQKYQKPEAPKTDELLALPDEWVWTNIYCITVYGPQNGLYLPQSAYGAGIPILRIDDFQDGSSRPSSQLRCVNARMEDITRYSLNRGDVVINRVNSLTHLGKCLVISDRNLPSLFESNMMRLRLSDNVDTLFIEIYLRSDYGRGLLISNAKWAVNQASINQNDVNNTAIPLPPLAEQQQIVAEVERRLSIVTQSEAIVNANLKRAERLRQSILKEAFAGRLVPQDPNDEPASVLLERIHKEHEGQKQGPIKKARAIKTISVPRMPDVEPMQIDASEMEQMDLWASIGSRE